MLATILRSPKFSGLPRPFACICSSEGKGSNSRRNKIAILDLSLVYVLESQCSKLQKGRYSRIVVCMHATLWITMLWARSLIVHGVFQNAVKPEIHVIQKLGLERVQWRARCTASLSCHALQLWQKLGSRLIAKSNGHDFPPSKVLLPASDVYWNARSVV